MQLKVVGVTRKPEARKFEGIPGVETAEDITCVMARNDYMSDWVGDKTFEEIMEPIGGDTLKEKKESLIHKLLRPPGHFGVFEHTELTVSVKGVSVITERQVTRHRIATFDVQSMRYVDFDDPDFIEIPELENPGLCGRNAEFDDEYTDGMDDEEILYRRNQVYEEGLQNAVWSYNTMLDLGVAPENARAVLPLGTKVNMGMTLNVRSIMHIADMRAAADAQWEAQELAERLLDKAAIAFPITVQYYRDNLQNRKHRLAP